MELESLTANLLVQDVEKTIDYYEKLMGFTLISNVPQDGKKDWAMMKRENIMIMFQNIAKVRKDVMRKLNLGSTGSGVTLYMKMKGVDELFTAIEEQVEVVSPPEETFYSTIEFSILDLNGYLITFAEDLE